MSLSSGGLSVWLGMGLLALSLAWLPSGCKEHGPPLPPGAKAGAPEDPNLGKPRSVEGSEKLRGRVRFGPKQWPLAMMLGHDAKADLYTHCLDVVERAKKSAAEQPADAPKAKVPPLCYDGKPRDRVTSIRVEFDAKGTGGRAVRMLADKFEAAHIYIEPSGSVYQILNLAFAPRRDGAYRAGEVRVLSANAQAHKTLVKHLTELLGPVPVTEAVVTFPPLAPKAPPDKLKGAPAPGVKAP